MAKTLNSYSALRQEKENNIYPILVSLLLLLAPFFRGLFFDSEFFLGTIYVSLVFVVFYIKGQLAKEQNLVLDYMSLAGWGIFLGYLVSLAVSLNVRGTVGELMRWGTYILVYYLVAYGTKDKREIDYYLKVIYVAGVFVALAGLGTAFGTFNFASAFEKETGRILSTIQYANSLAVYLTAVLLIGLYLISRFQNKLAVSAYAAGNFLLFITIIGTQSRGAWLVLPVVVVALLLLQHSSLRLSTLASLIIAVISTFAVSSKVLTFDTGLTAGAHWVWLLIGLLLAIALQHGVIKLFDRPAGEVEQSGKSVIAISGGVLALMVIVGVILVFLMPGLLPEKFVARVASINFQQHSVQERFYFYKDAIRVIKDYPLLGTGGKGWEDIYQRYQSYLYLSKQIHNHFLQLWVEAGILGFASFVALWTAFFRVCYRTFRLATSPQEKGRIAAILAAALTLGLHSMIDFNLSIGAIMILLWCLFGLTTAANRTTMDEGSGEGSKSDRLNVNGNVLGGICVGLACILVLASVSFKIGISHGNKGVAAGRNQDILVAEKELTEANKYDPLNASYLTDLAQIDLFVGGQKKDDQLIKKGLEFITKAKMLDYGNQQTRAIKARVHFGLEQLDEGAKEIENTLELGPWIQGNYENAAVMYFQYGELCRLSGKLDQAKTYYTKAVGVTERLNKQISKLTPQTKELWIRADMLAETPAMKDVNQRCKEYLKAL